MKKILLMIILVTFSLDGYSLLKGGVVSPAASAVKSRVIFILCCMVFISCQTKEDHEKSFSLFYGHAVEFMQKGKSKDAVEAFMKAERYADKTENDSIKTLVYIGIGELLNSQKLYPQAFDYFEKAYQRAAHSDDYENEVKAILGQIPYLYSTKQYGKCIDCYKKAMFVINDDLQTYTYLASIYNGLADCNYQLGNYKSSIQYCQLCLKELSGDNSKSIFYHSYYLLARNYIQTDCTIAADNYMKTVIIGPASDDKINAYDYFYERSKSKGRYKDAVMFVDNCRATRAVYERGLHEQEIAARVMNNKIDEIVMQSREEKMRDIFIFVSVIVVILVLVFLGIFRFIKYRKSQKKLILGYLNDLSEGEEQKKMLRREIIHGQTFLSQLMLAKNRTDLETLHNLMNAMRVKSLSDDDWKHLYRLVSIMDRTLVKELNAVNGLDKRDVEIACLSMLGVKPQKIADIYAIDSTSITRIKTRIKQAVNENSDNDSLKIRIRKISSL